MFLSNLNFSLFFTSLLTTLLITFLAKPFFLRLGLVDIPNPRSNHNFPVALGGGIIITLLILSLGLYSKISFSFTCYSVFIMLFAISLLDDIKNINATIRLLFHMLCVFLQGGLSAPPDPPEGLKKAIITFVRPREHS